MRLFSAGGDVSVVIPDGGTDTGADVGFDAGVPAAACPSWSPSGGGFTVR
ncbi:MAG: hypothetical protein HY897_25660 [Deltaproteobacteria bacterium]|nr:hypothetical protein [Deltaproteobacteria bacterium]